MSGGMAATVHLVGLRYIRLFAAMAVHLEMECKVGIRAVVRLAG